jgi:hypothetical protein
MSEWAMNGVLIVHHGWRFTMKRRRNPAKPTLALWMLVAVADIVLLAVAAGPLIVMLCIAAFALVAGAVAGPRVLARRAGTDTDVVVRRRA